MNRVFFGFVISLLIFLSSCQNKKTTTVSYYNMDSLINAQVETLVASGAILTKKAEIDGVEETNTFTPKDSTAWANELDIFAELNVINNSDKGGDYAVEKKAKDPNSNLFTNSFTGKDVLPVVYLKIFYLNQPSQIRRLEALYREENALVKGSRLLILEFQELRDQMMLTSYLIEGSQKMFLGESVKFSIQGTISLP